jgi:colanic acid/amylovoran biosynthesis glycosyltransferase
MEWDKGYEVALGAIRLLIDRGIFCEYRAIGDGLHKQAVQFTCNDLGLKQHVKLLYAQHFSSVKEQMEWADVYLHPSVCEGFSNAVLQAQAMRLPVVCTDAGGLKENIKDGETGFVVPRRNAGAIADKLMLLAQDPEMRVRMGEAGRKRVISCFRIEDQIVAFDKLFSSVLHLDNSDEEEKSYNPTKAALECK